MKFGMLLSPCVSEEPPLWQNVSTETNYKLINQLLETKVISRFKRGEYVFEDITPMETIFQWKYVKKAVNETLEK